MRAEGSNGVRNGRSWRVARWAIVVKIAWRNLWRHTRRTLLTVSTIALGVALLLISFGLGDGSHKQMIDSAVRLGSGHVLVQAVGYQERAETDLVLSAKEADSVQAQAARLKDYGFVETVRRAFTGGLATSADGATGAQIIGLEAGKEARVSKFADKIVEGRFLQPGDEARAVVGQGVARKLELGLESRLVLMAQGAGDSEINSTLVRVTGVISTGMEDLDQIMVLVPLATLQDFLGLGDRVHQVAVFLDDFAQSGPAAAKLTTAFPDVDVLAWEDALPELRGFIVVDDGGNYVFHTFIFLIIGFTVLNTLLMSVLERNRELSLLDALGLRPAHRFFMVLTEAGFVALMATVAGLSLGYGIHLYLEEHGIPLMLFYTEEVNLAGVTMDPVLYSYLSTGRIVAAAVLVFGSTMLLALIPAARAAHRGNVSLLGSG